MASNRFQVQPGKSGQFGMMPNLSKIFQRLVLVADCQYQAHSTSMIRRWQIPNVVHENCDNCRPDEETPCRATRLVGTCELLHFESINGGRYVFLGPTQNLWTTAYSCSAPCLLIGEFDRAMRHLKLQTSRLARCMLFVPVVS